jgi:polysaccharide pyruvyl transferase WcaK-like protein
LGIPTLVLCYSVKAHGIALDLGMDEYLVDISKITNSAVLTDAFTKLHKNGDTVRDHLKSRLPAYMDMGKMYDLL